MTSLVARTLGLSILLLGSAIASPVVAQSLPLEQQLNMRRYQFERLQALQAAERFVKRADIYVARGQTAEAIADWQQAAELYRQAGESTLLLQVLEPLAKALIEADRFTEAEKVIQQQLSLAREQGDRAGRVYALNNLGVVWLQTEQLEEGTAAIAAALDLAEILGDPALIGLSISNLGLAARLSGDPASAQNYYESALNYRTDAGDLVGLAHTAGRLAEIYQQQGASDRALALYLDAREAALTANHIPTLLMALDGLIGIYAERGDLESLSTYVGERTVMTPDDGSPEQQLGLFTGLGLYYEQLADYPRAQSAYNEALAIAQQLDADPQRTFILNRLAGLTLLIEENS